jgi:hypothetical protein
MTDGAGSTETRPASPANPTPDTLPLSVPEAAGIDFGRLCPLRVGMALAKLSRLSNVPVEVLWVQFARICERRDAAAQAELFRGSK